MSLEIFKNYRLPARATMEPSWLGIALRIIGFVWGKPQVTTNFFSHRASIVVFALMLN